MEVILTPLEEVLSLPVYPTADIFPMLLKKAEAPSSTQAMCLTLPDFADQLILDQGVKEPIVIWKGMLVDGRNRRAAAELAVDILSKLNSKHACTDAQLKALEKLSFIPVREEEFEDEMEADRFIVALNVARRQLSKSQTAAVAALYWELYEGRIGRPSENAVKNHGIKGDTRDLLSRMFHVNNSYVDAAHKLFMSDPENFQSLHSGKKSLSETKKTPGQEPGPAPDPISTGLQQANDAYNKFKDAMTGDVSKSTGETRRAAGLNFETRILKLLEVCRGTYGDVLE